MGEAALVNGAPLLSAHHPTAPMYVKSESSMAVACRSAMVEGRVRRDSAMNVNADRSTG
jgi:hypothetical protein